MRQNELHLSEDDIRDAFESSFVPIKRMMDTMIEKFEESRSPAGPIHQINEILLVGGGSASPYLSDRIRDEYEHRGFLEEHCSIPVRTRANDRSGAANCIVQGALLLLMDKAFLRERVIRRGYCVKLDEITVPRDFSPLNYEVRRDLHDGTWRRVDVWRFLIRIGERVNHHHRASGPRGTWRGLLLDEVEPHGWDLEEEIFYSDSTSTDSLWIYGERNDIRPCGMLRFSLTQEDSRLFEVRESPIDGRRYKYLEYRVDFVIEGIDMTYQISIPRDGKLQGEAKQGLGRDPIRKSAQLDCAGVFELFSSV